MKRILFALVWCIYSVESLAATDEADTFAQEHVVVVGGGYAGVISSLLLSRVQTKDKRRMYRVSLVEKDPYIFQGTSLAVGRLHLGGEYPKDKETATQCMDGAVLFRQMFPPSLFSQFQRIAFMVSKADSKVLSPQQLQNHYEDLRKRYTEYWDDLKKEFADTAEERFFGSPEDVFTRLPEEDSPESFAGGMLTQERGWNVGLMGAALERLLKEEGVKVYPNQVLEKDDIQKVGRTSYEVYLKGAPVLKATQVVNATGADIFSLDPRPAKIGENKGLLLYNRLIVVADISSCTLPRFKDPKKEGQFIEGGIFGLLGENGGMFNPVTRNIALLYVPGNEYSYVQDSAVTHHFPKGPGVYESEEVSQSIKERAERIIESIKGKYGPEDLKNMRFAQAIVRPTLSADSKLEERRYIPVQSQGGYHNIVLTKATTAPLLGLHLLQNILSVTQKTHPEIMPDPEVTEWLEDFSPIKLHTPVLPEAFRFSIDNEKFDERVDIFLRQRGLHPGYNPGAEAQISYPTLTVKEEGDVKSQADVNYPKSPTGTIVPYVPRSPSIKIKPSIFKTFFEVITNINSRFSIDKIKLEKDIGNVSKFLQYCESKDILSPHLIYMLTNLVQGFLKFKETYSAMRAFKMAEEALERFKKMGVEFPNSTEMVVYANGLLQARELGNENEALVYKKRIAILGCYFNKEDPDTGDLGSLPVTNLEFNSSIKIGLSGPSLNIECRTFINTSSISSKSSLTIKCGNFINAPSIIEEPCFQIIPTHLPLAYCGKETLEPKYVVPTLSYNGGGKAWTNSEVVWENWTSVIG